MVTNVGKMASDEVVQVYASLPDATVPAPRVRLVAFQRVRAIAVGASVVVTLTVRKRPIFAPPFSYLNMKKYQFAKMGSGQTREAL
jgi:hypothetical protein